MKELHIKDRMLAKECGNNQFKIILTYKIANSVRPISKWVKLAMGSCKALFFQM
jgi:hypothetical protein